VGSQKNIMAELIILAREHVILHLDTALIYDTMLCTKVFLLDQHISYLNSNLSLEFDIL
jgi:hypothetical protein